MAHVLRRHHEDHVLGDIRGVVADPLEMPGDQDEIESRLDRRGVVQHVGQQLSKHLRLEDVEPVVFVEHGLDAHELDELRAAVRGSLRVHPLDSGWWDSCDLPLLVASTEIGYCYRGSGTDFWPLLETELEFEASPAGRLRIKEAMDNMTGGRQ